MQDGKMYATKTLRNDLMTSLDVLNFIFTTRTFKMKSWHCKPYNIEMSFS